MHTSLDLKLQRHLSPDRPGSAYRLGLACLLFLWIAAMVGSTVLAIVLLLPDHLGLTDVIRQLSHLLPTGGPLFTT